MLKKTNQKGFSIIEVLIVLAIAGLIMLIVFLAVPALRRNAANNGRQSDASRISTAVQDCLSNRNGKIDSCNSVTEVEPGDLSQLTWDATSAEQFECATGTCANPTGTSAGLSATVFIPTHISTTNDPDAISSAVVFKAKCTSDGSGAESSANARDFVVLYNRKTQSSVSPACIGS